LICISKDACIFFVIFLYHIKHKSYHKRVSSVTWIMVRGLKYLTAQVKVKEFKPLIKVWHPYSAKPWYASAKIAVTYFVIFLYHIKHKSYHKRVSSVTWIMIRGFKYLTAQVKVKVFKPLIKVWHLYSAKPWYASAKMPVIFLYHIKHKSYHKRVSSVTWIIVRGLKYLTA
jgi:hypothetical protein